MQAKGRAADTAHKENAWLAWQTATLAGFAFHVPKKMPSLESLTATPPKIVIQSPDQMRAVFAGMRRRAAK